MTAAFFVRGRMSGRKNRDVFLKIWLIFKD